MEKSLPSDVELLGLQAVNSLFDRVSSEVFYAKNAKGEFIAVSRSLIERCGVSDARDLLGKHARDLFPEELATKFVRQDELVLLKGLPIVERLELAWYPGRVSGWCLTSKQPLRDECGNVTGLVGLSRDLDAPLDAGIIPPGLADAFEYLDRHFAGQVTPAKLAQIAGLTSKQLTEHSKRIFGSTTRELITEVRLAAASRLLLETTLPVSMIALDCGFYDHSAFTTSFREATGATPAQFRKRGQEDRREQ